MTQSKLSRSRAAIVARGLSLTALALCAGLASGDPSRIESVIVYEARFDFNNVKANYVDTAPVILVANPSFKDPQWRETVLLATPLPNGGHVGVIINRPMQVKLGQLFPEHGPSQKVLEPVYYGGPFFGDVLVAELEKELWSVHDASTETVFRTDMELLWKELSIKRRGTLVGGPLPTLAFTPESRSR